MKITITTTTINVPHLLVDYAEDIKNNGYKDVDFIIAGDKKTPLEAAKLCETIEKNYAIRTDYMTVEDQISYLKKYPELGTFLPWNCIERRNLAILKAYNQGSDIIVMIDDDNYLAQKNYIGGHGKIGEKSEIDVVSTIVVWQNWTKKN